MTLMKEQIFKVRFSIKFFNSDKLLRLRKGLAILKAGSHRPHHISTTFPAEKLAPLQDILHQSPRNFGKDTSLWTLPLLAEVSYREGVAERLVSGEAIRMALKRLDIAWKRAKRWINSPDPAYLVKKNSATG